MKADTREDYWTWQPGDIRIIPPSDEMADGTIATTIPSVGEPLSEDEEEEQ